MAVVPCASYDMTPYNTIFSGPEPHAATYPAITDELLQQIDNDTNQDELAGGMIGQAFEW